MSREESVRRLLESLGAGETSLIAYDTAWVARLLEVDRPLGGQAMDWLCEHQLPDGSWGAEAPLYYHDRIISTLAAMTALCKYGRRSRDRLQIERGLQALNALVKGATRGLPMDPRIDTVGFELIAPTLVAEAESLGLIQSQSQHILGRLAEVRAKKLGLLQGYKINRWLSTAFNAEMAGTDHLELLDIDHLQEDNGSCGCSPSATAYFALHVRPGDPAALEYLRRITKDGGAPDITPFETTERLWVMWNLALACPPGAEPPPGFAPHLEYMEANWKEGAGLGFSVENSIPDPDNTSIGYQLLHRFGRKADLEALLAYEVKQLFRTYALEATPSVSTNIHALGALRQAGYPADHPTIESIAGFMLQSREALPYWFDKWHLSPYYTSSHAVITCAGWKDELIAPAVEWVLGSQNPDGSWGWIDPTAEETAYALQALSIWRLAGGKVEKDVLLRGAAWLQDHGDPPFPYLEIGKGLFCPVKVVESAILSAQMLVEQAQ